MTTCLGGWCHLRDKCRYHEPKPGQPFVERLCEPKTFDAFEPLVVTRPAGTWEGMSGRAAAVWHAVVA